MICVYCEERVNKYSPDVVGGHGEYAHRRCVEEKERSRHTADAESEITYLRRRVRELEDRLAAAAPLPAVDPHDPDGGENEPLHCPHGGRYIRGH